MKPYSYENNLVSKKQLKQILAWSFSKYDCVKACTLAEELKSLGFKYATKAGISISIEDLRVPFAKSLIVRTANNEDINSEKLSINGQITEVEKFQKIIDIWSFTSELLKAEVVSYFSRYDPLNSVYMMAFSGARGNLTQVRQLVGIRGLMSDPNGELLNLPIKKNFREGLTITDYLISGYGARKGIVDTALKTANSGYLTRRLIDVAQDIVIKEKDCLTDASCLLFNLKDTPKSRALIYNQILGRLLNKPIYDVQTNQLLVDSNTQLTPNLLRTLKQKKIDKFYVRSPFTCRMYRSICQKCYGWNLAEENLVDIGEAVGIIAGQSIGEPGTQLTMRTFHTGGIFTASISQQLVSPIKGTIELSKSLKTSVIRTNRGENILYTQNSGLLQIIPIGKNEKSVYFTLLRNTLIFVRNGQLVNQSSILCQFLDTSKQTKTETRYILSDFSGEVYMPRFPRTNKTGVIDKLFWILSGHVYQAPKSSFLNFPVNHRINNNSYVFRTKILAKDYGLVSSIKFDNVILQPTITLVNEQYSLRSSIIYKLLIPKENSNFLLSLANDLNYSLSLRVNNGKVLIPNLTLNNVAKLVTNDFHLFIGGTLFYDYLFKLNCNFFYTRKLENIGSKTAILEKCETYCLHCNVLLLNVINNTYVSKNCEILPGIFTKTSGILSIKTKKNIIRELSVNTSILCYLLQLEYPTGYVLNTGEIIYKHFVQDLFLLHQSKNLNNFSETFLSQTFSLLDGVTLPTGEIIYKLSLKRLFNLYRQGLIFSSNEKLTVKDIASRLENQIYYPGEFLFNYFWIKEPSVIKKDNCICNSKQSYLICPLELYEVPSVKEFKKSNLVEKNSKKVSRLTFNHNRKYYYESGEKILTSTNISLIDQFLEIDLKNSPKSISINVGVNFKKTCSYFTIVRKLCVSNYIVPTLRERKLESSFIVKNNQFVHSYSTLVYLEAVTKKPFKIIQLKVKFSQTKQIFLILNHHCKLVKKSNFPNKKVNEFLINETILKETGKIIADNGKVLTIQYGKPYFFPNCKDEMYVPKKSLQYYVIPKSDLFYNLSLYHKKYINSRFYDIRVNSKTYVNRWNYNIKKFNVRRKPWSGKSMSVFQVLIKKEDKFYLCGIPVFLRQILVKRIEKNPLSKQGLPTTVPPQHWKCVKKYCDSHLIFCQNTNLITNQLKLTYNSRLEFASLVYFNKYKKRIFPRIHAITEDYFEREVNNLYCENGEFIEQGKTIALLKLEKEITDDIVQGLPRIESLLEARNPKRIGKTKPKCIKKDLLVGKTSIDPMFEYRKIGTPIKEDEKINPKYLVTIYFKYYTNLRYLGEQNRFVKSFRLTNDFMGAYRTFKKVQSLILNSVQSIYISQGVKIADKHLELIIRQMTTKVQITKKGGTTLLVGEIVDLYHIKYMNKVSFYGNEGFAEYVPFLLGITKTALNSPSFISAASFQETTRVLTKAAIEGRKDWLKGLKENIVIGHLIPSGTGFKTCSQLFNRHLNKKITFNQTLSKIRN